MARKPAPHRRERAGGQPAGGDTSGTPREIGRPLFAQPVPTEDPSVFHITHASDGEAYKEIDQLNRQHKIHPLPFPAPRGGGEPLTLQEVLGGNPVATQATQRIIANGRIVFHATGDCGSTRGPKTQNEVAGKMVSDFQESHPKEVPKFNVLLGDIVYSFGEAQYYYDEFYEPYRDYAAPILAVAGNHDGMVAPHVHVASLAAAPRAPAAGLRDPCAARTGRESGPPGARARGADAGRVPRPSESTPTPTSRPCSRPRGSSSGGCSRRSLAHRGRFVVTIVAAIG